MDMFQDIGLGMMALTFAASFAACFSPAFPAVAPG
jgi:hypothetical protein